MNLEKFKNLLFRKKNYPNKADINNFVDYPVLEFSDELIQSKLREYLFFKNEGGLRYDFLLSKKKNKKLFILFSGYVDRKKLAPPVFQRWKWVDRFPGSVLYVSDPALHLDETISLGWYIGTKKEDCYNVISEVILHVAKELEISCSDIIGYGSSGGGYASIRMSDFIPEMTCVAINPQIEIHRYFQKPTINKFLKVCFNENYNNFDFKKNSDRFSLIRAPEELADKKVILAQNILDTHHYNEHYLPYCTARGVNGRSSYSSNNFKTIVFENKGGHSGAETNEVFHKIMKMIKN